MTTTNQTPPLSGGLTGSEKIVRRKFDSGLARLEQKRVLMATRNKPAGAAALRRISPPVNSGDMDADHFSDGLGAATNLDDTFSGGVHGGDIATIAIPLQEKNAINAIAPTCEKRKNVRMDLEWIKRGCDKPGKSQLGLAKALGINASGVNRMISGERKIKVDELPVIAAYLEEAPPIPWYRPPAYGPEGAPASAYSAVRQFDIRAGGGHGISAPSGGEPFRPILFRTDWLRKVSTAPLDRIYGVMVEGNSMSPTLKNGDLVVFDGTITEPTEEGEIFVFMREAEDGEKLQVKRLLKDPVTGHITVRSDNPNWKEWTETDPAAITIAGRVFWMGRQI